MPNATNILERNGFRVKIRQRRRNYKPKKQIKYKNLRLKLIHNQQQ